MQIKKTLIVTAHPSSQGFTHLIAGVLKDARIENGAEVEILDLYKTDLKQDFLKFEDPREMKNPDPIRDAIQAKMAWADELIFIHPLWWLTMPAIMKNFLDHNIASPFAFHYENGKRIPGLCGRSARLYITCDGPILLYIFLGLPFIINWVIGIFTFCGISTDYFKIIRMLPMRGDEVKRKKVLERIKKNSFRRSFSLKGLNFLGNMFQ
ncbi:MAG: NAD(P)H-dependent oxidoreductase [Patescibacteria group bacterium]